MEQELRASSAKISICFIMLSQWPPIEERQKEKELPAAMWGQAVRQGTVAMETYFHCVQSIAVSALDQFHES